MFTVIKLDGAGTLATRPVAGTVGLRPGYCWMDETGQVTMYTGTTWISVSISGATQVNLRDSSGNEITNLGGATPTEYTDDVGVAVAQAGLTLIASLDVSEKSTLFFSFSVSGAGNLDEFEIRAVANSNGNAPEITYFNTPADFQTPRGRLLDASDDLTTLATGSNGSFTMEVDGIHTINIYASSDNAAGSTVKHYAEGL